MGTKYISRKKNRRGNWVKYRDDRLVTAQQSTGAAQIANLKYILKNGSTGEFVEALDSIINERVRVALGQLVNNLDKGTGLAKVLGIDASNDLGSSSLANLASMLGGSSLLPVAAEDINIDTYSGRFICISQINRLAGTKPISAYNWYTRCIVIGYSFIQLCATSGDGSRDKGIYVRSKNTGESSWGAWSQL